MNRDMMFMLLLVAAEGAAPAASSPPVPSWLVSPAQIAKSCEVYPAGSPREWCIRQATEKTEQARQQWEAMETEKKRQLEAARAAGEARGAAARAAQVGAEPRPPSASVNADSDLFRDIVNGAQQPTSPEEMQFVWSAKICDRAAERAQALADIAKERRYSKIGGVVHLKRLGDLQDEVASADDDIKDYRAELKAIGKRAVSCKDPRVAEHRE
jgi:hypothetical protein